MKATGVQIVDIGRGLQLAGQRITVMDIFYYLHRGRDFDFIHRVMPSLSREEFDAVVQYISEHHDELVEEDRLVDEHIRQAIAEQNAKGLHREVDLSITVEERVAQLKETLRRKLAKQAEKNGGQPPH